MKTVKLIIVGFGVIGRGVAETLLEKKKVLRDIGLDFKVAAVCEINGSLIEERGVDLEKALELAKKGKLEKHKSWSSMKSLEVLEKMEADVMLELTPGDVRKGEPGLSHIKLALQQKMHVVTSNKSPLALHYSELHELAGRNNVQIRFEATVGGAIPIINLYEKCLQVNEVENIYGVLNGTTNYVLSKMAEEGIALEDALNEAMELGIAEADPSYDIDGIDSALKVAILANAILGRKVSYRDVSITGIREITQEAIELAKKHGYVIKLIGDVGRLEVSPRLVPAENPLNVSGSLNAVMIDSDIAGELTLVGYGAGGRETASSIFSDLVEIFA